VHGREVEVEVDQGREVEVDQGREVEVEVDQEHERGGDHVGDRGGRGSDKSVAAQRLQRLAARMDRRPDRAEPPATTCYSSLLSMATTRHGPAARPGRAAGYRLHSSLLSMATTRHGPAARPGRAAGYHLLPEPAEHGDDAPELRLPLGATGQLHEVEDRAGLGRAAPGDAKVLAPIAPASGLPPPD